MGEETGELHSSFSLKKRRFQQRNASDFQTVSKYILSFKQRFVILVELSDNLICGGK
jgi:hypothetical protein